MNRSVLLVICDFLILTLLSFVQFDATTTEGVAEPAPTPAAGVSAPAMSNMLATLQSALELERMQRDALTNALAASSAELAERLRLLSERESALTNAQVKLEKSELDAQRLAEERARLDRARAEAAAAVRELQVAFETTRRSADSLQDRLSDTTREAAAAKARLQTMEEEMVHKREEAQAMQQQIRQLDATRENLNAEKYKLTTELRLTEAEATVARRDVTNLTQQLVTTGVEKRELIQTAARLATNVTTLTQESTAIREQSTAIREQIERQIRLPANQIYADYLTNRVRTEMSGTTRGALGQEVVRRREALSVLVRIGGRVYAVLHLEQTPLRLWPTDAPWTAFSGVLLHGDQRVAAREFALLNRDPRVALIPVDAATVSTLGARVYDVAKDPAQFSDAVVIGGEESYYGESNFRLNPENLGYVQMERSTFRRWMGDFSPRRGDLAFTKTGELLGILVNGDQCLVLESAVMLPAFPCGDPLNPAPNTAVVRSAQAILDRMPSGLR